MLKVRVMGIPRNGHQETFVGIQLPVHRQDLTFLDSFFDLGNDSPTLVKFRPA